MYFSIFLILFPWLIFVKLPPTSALKDNKKEKCPFRNTVNLTNHQSFKNGSYLYQDILIPNEKQHLYDYDMKFLETKVSVPQHRRGCVCEERACLRLCCEQNGYFNITQNTHKCEKLLPNMEVSWELSIHLQSGKPRVVNILNHFTTQVGLPCHKLKDLNVVPDRWILSQNGSLLLPELNQNFNTLDYCYSPVFSTDTSKYILTPFSCTTENRGSWKVLLNSYGMTVSVLFLILTMLVYLVLKELRGNLSGKLMICYLLSLTMGFTIISFINISGQKFHVIPCSILGFSCYFFLLAAFCWLNVICYDIWKNVNEVNSEVNSAEDVKQFIIYSLYAWLSAAVATGISVWVELSPSVDEKYKPGIHNLRCWLNTERWSAAIYFFGPTLVILLLNLIAFVHLTSVICKVRCDLARMTTKERFFREDAIIIFRLYLIMGISWLFDVLSYCLSNRKGWEYLFLLSDFFNAIQGILIFVLFVLKPNVLKLLKNRFYKTHIEEQQMCISTATANSELADETV